MRVEIRTTGGFTGRGIGNILIEDARSLRPLIEAALLSGAPAPSPSRGGDEITYTMTISRGDATRTFHWTDSAPAEPAVLELFDAARAARR
jgi:hypothetical protein